MVALDIIVTAHDDWNAWHWWRLTPPQILLYDIVNLGLEYRTPTSTWMWMVTQITLEGQGRYRIEFCPIGSGSTIDLLFSHTSRLAVQR